MIPRVDKNLQKKKSNLCRRILQIFDVKNDLENQKFAIFVGFLEIVVKVHIF